MRDASVWGGLLEGDGRLGVSGARQTQVAPCESGPAKRSIPTNSSCFSLCRRLCRGLLFQDGDGRVMQNLKGRRGVFFEKSQMFFFPGVYFCF